MEIDQIVYFLKILLNYIEKDYDAPFIPIKSVFVSRNQKNKKLTIFGVKRSMK